MDFLGRDLHPGFYEEKIKKSMRELHHDYV